MQLKANKLGEGIHELIVEDTITVNALVALGAKAKPINGTAKSLVILDNETLIGLLTKGIKKSLLVPNVLEEHTPGPQKPFETMPHPLIISIVPHHFRPDVLKVGVTSTQQVHTAMKQCGYNMQTWYTSPKAKVRRLKLTKEQLDEFMVALNQPEPKPVKAKPVKAKPLFTSKKTGDKYVIRWKGYTDYDQEFCDFLRNLGCKVPTKGSFTRHITANKEQEKEFRLWACSRQAA